MPTALPRWTGRPTPAEHDRRREVAARQREAAAAVHDSVRRSALMLAAEVLDAEDEVEAYDRGAEASRSTAACGSPP